MHPRLDPDCTIQSEERISVLPIPNPPSNTRMGHCRAASASRGGLTREFGVYAVSPPFCRKTRGQRKAHGRPRTTWSYRSIQCPSYTYQRRSWFKGPTAFCRTHRIEPTGVLPSPLAEFSPSAEVYASTDRRENLQAGRCTLSPSQQGSSRNPTNYSAPMGRILSSSPPLLPPAPPHEFDEAPPSPMIPLRNAKEKMKIEGIPTRFPIALAFPGLPRRRWALDRLDARGCH
jgi:hypothetical protein